MKAFWGKGDRGETMISSKKINKNSTTIALLGSLDELNAQLGNLICYLEGFSQQKVQLLEIIKDIFAIAALVSESPGANYDIRRVRLLETWTAGMNEELPKLDHFILPTGNKASCSANITRTVARRCEVVYFNYYQEVSKNEDIGAYLNRLSDYLFVLVRYINQKYGIEDYFK